MAVQLTKEKSNKFGNPSFLLDLPDRKMKILSRSLRSEVKEERPNHLGLEIPDGKNQSSSRKSPVDRKILELYVRRDSTSEEHHNGSFGLLRRGISEFDLRK